MASLDIEELKKILTPILKAHDVVRASLFGSVVRGEAGEGSDIDVLIDFGDNVKSLFELADLQFALEGKTGKKVDLAFFETLKPRIKGRILAEQVPIYDQRSSALH